MRLPLEWIAAELETGRDAPLGVEATGYSIDSRTVGKGDLFFALPGERADGHDFVEAALDAGAVGAVVRRDFDGISDGPLLRVDEPAAALRTLAAAAREHWGGRVVGVTGSNGKTTTKEVIAAMLAVRLNVAKTPGNFNNELGLPLSLLRVDDDADVAVLEMGMNHAGEIRRLARTARPDIGVVTNVSEAHIGHFDSIEGVALAKRELVEALGPEGVAVLNADDPRVRAFAEAHSGRSVLFGTAADADFRVEDAAESWDGLSLRLTRKVDQASVELKTGLLGRHQALNLAAGFAVASEFALEPEELVDVVAVLRPAAMRGEALEVGGVRILNDCYNANPASSTAAVDLFAKAPGRRRIAVLGEMRELGGRSRALHAELGRRAAAAQLDRLLAVGGDARYLAEAAVEAGLPESRVDFHRDAQTAGAALLGIVAPGDAVLFKGSRGVRLENALARLRDALEAHETGEAPEARKGGE